MKIAFMVNAYNNYFGLVFIWNGGELSRGVLEKM